MLKLKNRLCRANQAGVKAALKPDDLEKLAALIRKARKEGR